MLAWLRPGDGGAHCTKSPPSVQPAARPDLSGPSRTDLLSCDCHCGKRVTSEGPDKSGVNGLTPGPCYSSAGYCRQARACRNYTRLPFPSLSTEVGLLALQVQ